jgi:hypothetical protein
MKTKMGSNASNKFQEDLYDFNSISFVEPGSEQASLTAKCMENDYVVVMHLTAEVKDLIINNVYDIRHN